MNYQTYTIKQNYKSIYYFLKEEGFSENYISNLRKTFKNFKVNGEFVDIRKELKFDDVLEINNNPNSKTSIMHCILPLDIVYEDKYYLLVNKPSGLSCMPTRSHYSSNLAGAICYHMKDKDENFVLRMVNRLDKDTAGIIIVAKDSISLNKLKEIEKEYVAVCEGKIDKEIVINDRIKTITINGINQLKRVISIDGLEATTKVTPLISTNDFSLIKLNLVHGRTHQIRVHLSSINHPLVGDELYGHRSDYISHAALICKNIYFYHPYLNKKLSFTIDYPDDFKLLLKQTNLDN